MARHFNYVGGLGALQGAREAESGQQARHRPLLLAYLRRLPASNAGAVRDGREQPQMGSSSGFAPWQEEMVCGSNPLTNSAMWQQYNSAKKIVMVKVNNPGL